MLNHTTDAPGVTLAGHSRASKLQAGSADPLVYARQGAYQTAAFQSVKSLHGGIYAPLHVIK